MTAKPVFLMILVAFLLFSCSETKQYVPRETLTHYELKGLPSNIITVVVNDLRSGSVDGLAEVLRGDILKALSPIPSDRQERFVIIVDVVEHQSFVTIDKWPVSSSWIARTRLRIRLVDSSGKQIGQWNAVGNAKRLNVGGYLFGSGAKLASQESYNIAIGDMMSLLSSVSLRKNVRKKKQALN